MRSTDSIRLDARVGLFLVVLSLAVALLTIRYVGHEMQIRWTIGHSHHIGPETVSTRWVTGGFLVTVLLLVVGGIVGREYLLAHHSESPSLQPLYDALVFTSIGVVLLMLVGLAGANVFLAIAGSVFTPVLLQFPML